MTHLLQEFLETWGQCAEVAPDLGRVFTVEEQRAGECAFQKFAGGLQAVLEQPPLTRGQRVACQERISAAFLEFARGPLHLDADQIRILFEGGLSSIGTQLARRARQFDADVSTVDILQANRNAWTACGLQMLLGRPMRLTPGIFAYSMLYPYSDNYLDDPTATRAEKMGFNERFGRRLAGKPVVAANRHEALIWDLVGLIEGEFSRAESPAVFESLMGIHHAQERSLRLLHGKCDADEVLPVVFEKGGASVLADGYLAAGELTEGAARFVYGWGIVLQLADDLQDVEADRQSGVRTLFTLAAEAGRLDELTARTMQFAGRVMSLMRGLPGVGQPGLARLIQKSTVGMLVRSAGALPGLYSPGFLAGLERHSAFRFGFVNECRARVAGDAARFARLFEAFLAGGEDEPAFPVLPSTMWPR
jgi:hypothetical protein